MTVLLLMYGCALPGSSVIRVPGDAMVISGVPRYSHRAFHCGPAALASVLNYWSKRAGLEERESPEEIAAAIYSEGARGTLGLDLELYASHLGYSTRQYSGSFDDLRSHAARGRPLIIFVDYGYSVYQRNHFMVVTGYNESGIVVLSEGQPLYISVAQLEKPWEKTGNWTLLIEPSSPP
ncbi:MAG: C39 family peptidase [Nitrospiraceae bacterium]|nr:MAG: C39 family peptidase [Nitrospiraceae bacterium]